MRKYNEYKFSGIEWLNNIPSTWTVKRIKDLSTTTSGTTPLSKNKAYYENGIYNWIRTTDLNNSELYQSEYKVTHTGIAECNLSFIPIESILVAMYGGFGTIGKNSILKTKSTINQSVCAILPKPSLFNSTYLLYFFKYFRKDWKLFADGARKDPNINQDAIKNLFIILPPLEEQNLIASFLDQKTAAIDKKILLLETKMTYYKELSKSIINEAVCKGLKKNMPLKESGIDWIGQIPKHWQIKRLKDVGYLYSGLSGKVGEDFHQEVNSNTKYYIPFTNIANNKYINHEDFHTVEMNGKEKQNRVIKNDLFFLMSSEGFGDIGKAALLIEDVKGTYLNSFCKGYRINKKGVVPRYLNYLLNSPAFRNKFIVQGKGFTRINLKMEKVSDFHIIIPPMEEQTEIADYLDNKTKTIEAIVKNITAQIDALKELRKTLINDVVTGKLRVSEQ